MKMYTWEEAYRDLWHRAADCHGVHQARHEAPGHMLYQRVAQWPRTRGADVVAIAAVLDPILSVAASEAGGASMERRWLRCAADLADLAIREPEREYRHNRAFWSAVVAASAHLASVGAPVPVGVWRALLDDLQLAAPPRNAPAVDDHLHLVAFTYDEMWQVQKAALAKQRGADVRAPVGNLWGGRTAIPRTTNADVIQLATYWTQAIGRVERGRRAAGPDGEIAPHAVSLDAEIRRWRGVLIDVNDHAVGHDPAATYARNEALWRAAGSLSIVLDVIDEAPTPFEIALSVVGADMASERRNASYPGEGSFETMWDRQHKDFVEARGFDLREPPAGRVGRAMKIPRTINGEIVKLAAYWNAAWRNLESKRGVLLGSLPTEQGLDGLRKRWQAVMADVNEIAEPGKADDVYPRNHEFWREAFEVAQTLDQFHELPSKFDIAIDVASTIPDRFASVIGSIANTVGDLAHKAGDAVLTSIGKPLLLGGGVILGGVVLWRLLRKPDAQPAGGA
jgi:hypothetical protein